MEKPTTTAKYKLLDNDERKDERNDENKDENKERNTGKYYIYT